MGKPFFRLHNGAAAGTGRPEVLEGRPAAPAAAS